MMKIEVGKTYLTRGSCIIKITGKSNSSVIYPLEGVDQTTGVTTTYTTFGEYEKGIEHIRDLVSLYPTPDPTPDPTPTKAATKAATDKVGTGLILIPLYSLFNLGSIFIEGLRYGKDNWKKGVNDKEYQEERLEHALLHLIKYKEGDRSEEHLAKVAWFCFTQLELERLEKGDL